MYNYLVASHNPVFKSPLFLFAFFYPVFIGISLALLICQAENLTADIMGGKSAVDLFWAYMKVPIALTSLSIPLASWVIANHRSSQLVESLNKQEIKRLHDLYYDHANYFVKTFGRYIKTHNWLYLEEEDLYLIHRSLYHHNIEQGNDNFDVKKDVVVRIEEYCEMVKLTIDEFLDDIDSDELAPYEKTKLILKLTCFLIEKIDRLSTCIGSKPLTMDTSLIVPVNAINEIISLYHWAYQLDNTKINPIDGEKLNQVAEKSLKQLGLTDPSEMKPSFIEPLMHVQEQGLI